MENHKGDERGGAIASDLEKKFEAKRELKGLSLRLVQMAALAIGLYEVVFIFNLNMVLYDLLYKMGLDLQVLTVNFQNKQSQAFILGMIFVIAFLLYPPIKKESLTRGPHPIDLVLCAAGLLSMGHMFLRYPDYVMFQDVGKLDVYLGLIAIALVLEGTRRTLGWVLPAIVSVFLVIGIRDTGYNWPRFVEYLYINEGIFGTPFFVMTIFVFAFIFFGAFLLRIGVSDYATLLMIALFGSRSGGPAKAAVVSSALMGCVSGSSVANVLTTGTFTIPLMKRSGYPPEVAGAIEPVASTGGQIMPPVMGAAAFIMSQFLGIPYNNIIIAAIIPAFVYYAGVYIFVDLETKRLGLKGMPKEELPQVRGLLRKTYLLFPVVVITVALVWGIAPHAAAISSLGLAVWAAWISKDEIEGSERIYVPVMLLGSLFMFTGDELRGVAALGSLALIALLALASALRPRGMEVRLNEKFSVSALMLLFIASFKLMGFTKEMILFSSGSFGVVLSMLVGLFSKKEVAKSMYKATFESLIGAGRESAPVMLAAASAGLIQGVLTMTGLVTSLGFKITALAGNNVLLILVMAMIFSLILGMGVPTTANYVITSLVAAPAVFTAVAGSGGIYSERVLGFGPPVALLAAHFFVFYFGILADLTPPVALASYAGSMLAQSDFWKTSTKAAFFALAGYLGPYIYFFNPEMLLITVSHWSASFLLKTAFDVFATLAIIYAVGGALSGYMMGRSISMPWRVSLVALSLACYRLSPIWVGLLVGLLALIRASGRIRAKGS